MTHQFKVGDSAVTHPSDRAAFEILEVRESGLWLGYFGFASFDCYPSMYPVKVVQPKPRRKLTLSAGLAWLKDHPNLALTAHVVPASNWGIWNFQLAPDSNGYRWIVRDCETPLKAIIAARKALGVK